MKFKNFGYAAFEYILLVDNADFMQYRDGKEVKGKNYRERELQAPARLFNGTGLIN